MMQRTQCMKAVVVVDVVDAVVDVVVAA